MRAANLIPRWSSKNGGGLVMKFHENRVKFPSPKNFSLYTEAQIRNQEMTKGE